MKEPEVHSFDPEDDLYRGQLPNSRMSLINRERERRAEEALRNTTNIPRPEKAVDGDSDEQTVETSIGAAVVESAHSEETEPYKSATGDLV